MQKKCKKVDFFKKIIIFNVWKNLSINEKRKMLKYIKVKNFLSFKDETVISFESDNRGKKKDNVFKEKNTALNKALLIYGANASGKTNILKVITFIQFIALHSATLNWEVIPLVF